MAQYRNSRVIIDRGRIRQLTEAAVRALEMTGEALHTEVVQAQVIPRRDGDLQNTTFCDISDSANGIVTLVSQMIYARRMYYHPEYEFSTAENPNARGRWYEKWISGSEKDFAKNAFKEFYRRNGGIT